MIDYKKLYENRLYSEDIDFTADLDLPWEVLMNKSVLISGATGLVGSFLVDVLMKKNENGLNCNIYIITRNKKKAESRFVKWNNNENIHYFECDVNETKNFQLINRIDFVFFLASNTHPLQYTNNPIEKITTNIIGLKNTLDISAEKKAERIVFASSNEVYGENRGETELFDEKYCGYIDSNTLRAGYPESKRCGEALCQAYRKEKNLDIVIPRLTRTYGPTVLMSDTKAISQFIKKAISNEDIVLKSNGEQYYSFTYVSDAVSGLLTVFFKGIDGEAYNIADQNSDIRLKELAEIVASNANKKVIYEAPDEEEVEGYSKATYARLDSNKLKELGWNARYSIQQGIDRTLKIMKCMQV